MTMVGLPMTLFAGVEVLGGIATFLSDILVLSVKEFEDKLRSDEGELSSSITGDLATLTANTGKDMYLANAKFTVRRNGVSTNFTVELSINGVTIEVAEALLSDGADGNFQYEFVNIGRKVTTGQIIKLAATTNSGVIINGVIECFEEDTGVNPLDDFQ